MNLSMSSRLFFSVAAGALLLGVVAALVLLILDQDKLNSRQTKLDPTTAALAPRFENIGPKIGLRGEPDGDICSANAAGAAILDKDKSGARLVLGSYQGDTIVWNIDEKKARIKQNLGRIAEATGLAAADYNNDGREDLLVASQRGPRLFQNKKGRLVDVTQGSGLRGGGLGMAGSWGDFNRDGLLDLVLTQGNNCVAGDSDYHFGVMRLYRQNKNHTFSVADNLLMEKPRPGLGMAVAFVDLNDDGFLDIYQGNDYLGGVPNQAWRNEGGRKFIPDFRSSEIEVNSMGLGLGDINRDQKIDISISNIEPIKVLISNNSATSPQNTQYTTQRLTQANPRRVIVTWGLITEDFNNDGWEDIWSPAGGIEDAGPEPQSFFLNKTRSPGLDRVVMQEIGQSIGLGGLLRGRAAATVDLNNDGLLDVALNSLNDPPALYINRGSQKKGRWLKVKLIGDEKKRSPRSACGAQVSLKVDQESWVREVECGSEGFLASSDKTLHFGVGMAKGDAQITITWPNGDQELHPVSLNSSYVFKQ